MVCPGWVRGATRRRTKKASRAGMDSCSGRDSVHEKTAVEGASRVGPMHTIEEMIFEKKIKIKKTHRR